MKLKIKTKKKSRKISPSLWIRTRQLCAMFPNKINMILY